MSRRAQLCALIVLLAAPSGAAEFTYALDDSGLPVLQRNGHAILAVKPHFWAPAWKYEAAVIHPAEDGSPLRLDVAGLGLAATAEVSEGEGPTLAYRFHWQAARDLPNAIGGGFEWEPNLESPSHGGASPRPELLEGNRGWEWRLGPGKRLRVRFEPALPRVGFKSAKQEKIRTMFFDAGIAAGSKRVTMFVELPKGAERVQTSAQRYAETSEAQWFVKALDPERAFIDLSHLNHKPAGKHGFVRADGAEFVLGDGTPIRFWGTNVQAASLFISDKQRIDWHARRIAAMGFNLVRLHHHDSQGWVKPSLIAPGPTTQELNPAALDAYFYWVKALREQGVYVWIDLHTGRLFKGGDGIPGFAELIAKAKRAELGTPAKGYTYVNARLRELMKEFNAALLTQKNPYTGLALKDDPAVMGVLVTNENDLTGHYGNALLPDKRVPYHHGLFKGIARAFAKRTGLPEEPLRATWKPGVAKILLNDMEYRFSRDMIDHLKKLGVKVPITSGHIWGGNGLASLPALTAGDFVDTHSYESGEFLVRNPRYEENFADLIARSQIAGKPLATSEWNGDDRADMRDPFTLPLYIAAMAAFQGWDAPMLYGYSQDGFRNSRVRSWSSYNHIGVMGLMPAAALIYRQGHVKPARETVVVRLNRQNLYMRKTGTELTLRTLIPLHRVAIGLPDIPELDWDEATPIPIGAKVVTDLERDFLPPGAHMAQSDTGELRRDWKTGIFTVDTPRSQAVVGWLDEAPVELGDVRFEIGIPKAAVAVTALDARPIRSSRDLLISAVARNTRDREGFYSEPVSGRLLVRHEAASAALIPLMGDGSQGASIELVSKKGRLVIELPTDRNTHWFRLVARD